MLIAINTFKRVNKQITLSCLPRSILDLAVLFVQDCEKDLYKDIHPRVVVLPPHITNLSQTRQFMLETCEDDKILYMDDDLRFNVRRDGDHRRLHKATDQEIEEMFGEIETLLCEDVPFVGVSRREGNNRQEKDYVFNTRIAQLWAVHVPTLRREGYRFDRMRTKQDIDMILQVLNGGRKNLCLYKWAIEGGNSNSAGGCSEYRTKEVLKEEAYKLAEMWPGIVRVVEKETKGSWGGGVRHDVHVRWKKAYTGK